MAVEIIKNRENCADWLDLLPSGDAGAERDARKARVRELTASEEYRALGEWLLGELGKVQAVGPMERDRVRAYMDLWVKRQLLSESVDKRGVDITLKNGSQKFVKLNEALGVMLQVSQAMDRILVDLGLKKSREAGADGFFSGWND